MITTASHLLYIQAENAADHDPLLMNSLKSDANATIADKDTTKIRTANAGRSRHIMALSYS